MRIKSECVVCGKRITYRFWLCSDCEELYGRRAREWPAWVRELINATARERRMTKKDKMLVSFDELIETNGQQPFTYMPDLLEIVSLKGEYATDMVDSDWSLLYDDGIA